MYADQQAMVDRFGEREITQLTDRDGTAGAIISGVLDQALNDAAETIDGYLRAGGYQLPLDPVPGQLQRIACDIARYYLYDDAQANEADPWVVRYRDALKMLGWIQSGKVTIGAPADGAGSPEVTAPRKVFDRQDLGDYQWPR